MPLFIALSWRFLSALCAPPLHSVPETLAQSRTLSCIACCSQLPHPSGLLCVQPRQRLDMYLTKNRKPGHKYPVVIFVTGEPALCVCVCVCGYPKGSNLNDASMKRPTPCCTRCLWQQSVAPPSGPLLCVHQNRPSCTARSPILGVVKSSTAAPEAHFSGC